MSVETKLRRWQQAGLISDTDVAKILAHEAAQQGFRFSTALFGLGALAIFLGIAAIIGSNWDAIPPSTKLISHGLINILLGSGVLYAVQKEKTVLREILLFLMAGAVLTFIALIGQIYQTGAPLWEALTLWLLLTTPFLFALARSRFTCVGWFLGFLATIQELIEPIHNALGAAKLDVSFYVLVPFVLIGAGQVIKVQDKWKGWTTFLPMAGYVLLAVTTSLAQLAWRWGGPELGETHASLAIALLVGWGASGLLFLLRRARVFVARDALIDLFAAVSVLLTFLPLLVERPYEPHSDMWGVFGAAIFMLYWGLIGWTALRFDRRGLLSFATVVIAARLVIIYIEVFGSLLSTGIGLIVSGILLIALVIGTQKLLRSFNKLARPI